MLTQAEAAAAFDLLALWRQCAVLGKQAEAVQYNLGLARYRWVPGCEVLLAGCGAGRSEDL